LYRVYNQYFFGSIGVKVLTYFLVGCVFSAGLVVSGMTQPLKVIGFLDIFGSWDPSLAFVMGTAVITTLVGYRIVFLSAKPLCEEGFKLPTLQHIDMRLIIGAVLFGIGWGISGLCPGPALASLVAGSIGIYVFVIAMFLGFFIVPKLIK
jgi:uncharacterized membrane protein YedE/YeeE